VQILRILLAHARRRAATRQQLTPDNLSNEWRRVADQQLPKLFASTFLVGCVEKGQHERILVWAAR
jgi:hypothetical protein